MNKIVVTHVLTGIGGVFVGAGIGYLIAYKSQKKAFNETVELINADVRARLGAVESQEAIITSGEKLELPEDELPDVGTPVFDELKAKTGPIALVDEASELEELPPDFPETPETTDDFTVEGEAPAIDARAFVEQFRERARTQFGGVSFPGQVDSEDEDAEQPDIPIRSVPDFVTVRDPNGPYVISIDEYMDPASDPPFTKVEMTWYAGDNVVTDTRGDQVPMSTVGQQNTLRMGEGTTDPNQVYIRNERLSIDIELTQDPGMYVYAVLGQDYPDKEPILKMRERDDG